MKPTDQAWQTLVRTAIKLYDPHGNRARQRWIDYIEADADGCWIWTGPQNNSSSGRYAYMKVGEKQGAAFTWLLRLWAPEELGNLPITHVRYRLCGKRLCTRPACATRDKRRAIPQSTFDLEELRRLRMVERLTIEECARRLGLSMPTVSTVCSREGWVHYTPKRLDVTLLYKMWLAGETRNAMMEATGGSPAGVSYWRTRFRHGWTPDVRDQEHAEADRKRRAQQEDRLYRLWKSGYPIESEPGYRADLSTEFYGRRCDEAYQLRLTGLSFREISRKLGRSVTKHAARYWARMGAQRAAGEAGRDAAA